MQSDNGKEFVNELVSKLLQAANVDHRLVASYNPRANGLAERTVGTVKRALLKKLEGLFDVWDDALVGVTHAINVTEGKLLKSPFSLFSARRPNSWIDYRLQDLHGRYQTLHLLQKTRL
jgi:transposase InsO family protein